MVKTPHLLTLLIAAVPLIAQTTADVSLSSEGHLQYSATFGGKTAIVPSPLGIVIGGQPLGQRATIETVTTSGDLRTYTIRQKDSGFTWSLDLRTFPDGLALRYRIPATKPLEVTREYTSFTFPPGTVAHFASALFQYGYIQRYVQVPTDRIRGKILAPPATFVLPNGLYVALTEANLRNFFGCCFEGTAPNTISVMFAECKGGVREHLPIGMPLTFRNTPVRNPAWTAPLPAGRKEIVTPWRVLMLANSLNDLTANGIIAHVADRPDPALFPNNGKEPWIRPGRSLWTWLYEDKEKRLDYDAILGVIHNASKLGYEYTLLDEGWEKWPQRHPEHPDIKGKSLETILTELCAKAAAQKVGIWVWRPAAPRHANDISVLDPKERERFFSMCARAGVKGLKLDFFHRENVPTVALMETLLREAAKHRLMVVFHGVNKPTGDSITYPNLMAKEAVSGLEGVGWAEKNMARWDIHDATLPFTRWLAGPADYTPVNFRRCCPTTLTFGHQTATAVLFTSPMLILGAEGEDLLKAPADRLFRDIPVTWDESRVLPPSKIGDCAIIARRHGRDWWLAAVGTTPRTLSPDLSFLGEGTWQMTTLEDDAPNRKRLRSTSTEVTAASKPIFPLLKGGGVLLRFTEK